MQVIAGTLGTLPARVYRRRPDGGKERAVEHPLYTLLHDAPNDLLTSCEFREMMQSHLCLRGNAYARVVRAGSGVVSYLEPIHPDRVSIFRRARTVTYSVQRAEGNGQDILSPDEMLHIRGMGPEGLVGYSPITLARESIGLAIATEKHGAKLFSNGARPAGVLETAGQMSKDQLAMVREEWDRTHAGVHNANKTAILFGGLKYSGVSMSNEDAQFLETRKFQVTDIARIFRVPPHKIADLSQATFSNIEHQSIEFVTDCIRPWAVRWEQRMNQVLLTPTERREYFIELSLDALLR
ncbi:MAG: phage portal protein, partial [Pseudomonadota bacterium]